MDQEQDSITKHSPPAEAVTPKASISFAPTPVVVNEAQIGVGGFHFRIDPEDTVFSVSAVIIGFLVLYAGIKAINLFFDKLKNK